MSKSQKVLLGFLALVLLGGAGAYLFLAVSVERRSSIGQVLVDNGYVEFKPPSRLVPPGTWVSVRSTDPLHLSLICAPDSALGIGPDQVSSSPSVDTKIVSALSGSFEADAALLSALNVDEKLSGLKALTFSLSNVRLVEVSDELVHAGIKARSDSCRDAIKFRLDTNEAVTMIKSSLIADVTYLVEFSGDLEVQSTLDVAKAIALELDVKVGSSTEERATLVGEGLIWGVREDAALARLGFGLPATGGKPDAKDVLGGQGPVAKVTTEDQARRAFPRETVLAAYDVVPLKQQGTMDCWATVYTMMKSWQDDRPLPVSKAVGGLGQKYLDYYLANRGLPGGEELPFVRHAGMAALPPANYALTGFVSALRENGPL